ncbi:MAG: tetratricopeptide repeat protein [Bryobacteraceae bacterium]
MLFAGAIHAAVTCAGTPFDCAMGALTRHDTAAAVATLREYLKSEPDNLKARNLLGIALLEGGQTKESAGEFRKALAQAPAFYPARKNLAVAQFTLGEFDHAKRNFEQVLEQHAEDPVSHLYLGELTFRSHDRELAARHFAKAGSSIGNIPAFTVHYAECLVEGKHIADAAEVLGKLPATDASAHFAAGMVLARAGAYAEAASFFRQAEQGTPDPYPAGYNEAFSYLQSGQHQNVVDAVNRMLRGGMSKGELLNLQASAYLKLNQVQNAYDSLRRAVQLSPGDESNYIDLANMCLDHDNFDLALDILNIGLKNIPDSARLRIHRGAMLAMSGKLPDAESDFQFAADLLPDAGLPRVALCLIWMHSGDLPKAIATLRQRDSRNTTDFTIPFLLGQALTRQGAERGSPEEQEAVQAFEKAVKLNPDYASARAELGKILLRKGEDGRAITELEKALSLDPQDRTAAYQLAQVYRKKGQLQRAAELRARVSDLNARDRDQDLRRAMVKIVRESANNGQQANAGLHEGQTQ